MARITLIEAPGGDEALEAVRAKVVGPLVTVVHVVHNSDPSGRPSPYVDVVTALRQLQPKLKSNSLESIDLVGHGAPGTIRVGATSARASKLRTSNQTQDWALLDSDVAKFESLTEAAQLLREWQDFGLLAPGFQVRLIGCNTAVDPGIVPDGLMTTLQDGAAFIHLMASFFDFEVAGTLGYIGVESFDANGFTQNSLLRSCHCGTNDSVVTFKPSTVLTGPPSDTKVGTLAVAGVTNAADPELKQLLTHYDGQAQELKAKLPLVIRDESIPLSGTIVDLVEEGKAVLLRAKGRIYRAKVHPERVLEAQHATLRFLARRGGPAEKAPPSWAARVATPAVLPINVQVSRGRRPATTAAP